METEQLELGTLEEVFKRYNEIIRARREKAGNTTWCEEWEKELSPRDIDILQIGSNLHKLK